MSGKVEYLNFKIGEFCTHAVQSEIKNRVSIIIRDLDILNKERNLDEDIDHPIEGLATITLYTCNLKSLCEALDNGLSFIDNLLTSVFSIKGLKCAMLNPMQSKSLSAAFYK